MFDVYMNRIRYDGTLGYSAAGLPVSDVWAMREDLAVAPDGGGGFLVAWSDHRNGADGIYAQRFTTVGMFEWEDDGAVVCTANNNQSEATIAPDGTGGTFLAWVDTRCITAERNIYCQVIERFGYWGDPAPAIAIVNDVPGDQGGFVTVAWEASRLDPAPYRQITHYGVWRAISPAAAAHRDGTEQGVSGSKLIKERLNDPIAGTVRSELREGQMWYWELAGMQMANFFEGYSMTVATLFDSSAASTEYHYFQVSAHTADEQVFWTSAPDSGYSVDNLAPAAPEGLAGEQSYEPVGLRLTWYPNAEEDLAGYRVYRGTASDFTPGPGNMIGGTADTLLFDDEWRWYEGYYYKVAAVDIHGNESGYALLAPDGVTGEEVVDMPTAAALRQNYPNPFNPSTTIRYYLPEDGHVRIEVLDIAGRRVCRIIDRRETRGWHEITWHGRSETGGAVASGAYFYRLVSSRDTITRKMVLLK
jgi:hypothetical protein